LNRRFKAAEFVFFNLKLVLVEWSGVVCVGLGWHDQPKGEMFHPLKGKKCLKYVKI
jgi:hypothetical protein